MATDARRPSKLERKVHSMLAEQGVNFLVHPTVETLVGGAWRRLKPDVVIPDRRVAIEVNGCHVHGCPQHGGRGSQERLRRHEQKVRALERANWSVQTIWEHDLEELRRYRPVTSKTHDLYVRGSGGP